MIAAWIALVTGLTLVYWGLDLEVWREWLVAVGVFLVAHSEILGERTKRP